MGKSKYVSMDNRTGYKENEIVELSDEELNRLPFNVFMKKLDEKKDEKKLEEITILETKNKLRVLLLEKGLSTHRTDKVLDEFSNEDEIVKNLAEGYVDKSKLDDVTKEFLKKEFSKPLRPKVSKETKVKKEERGD